ncbi:MAG: hypothetical protein ACR2PI_02830 [Hyphomicrobiaceae bacterium]
MTSSVTRALDALHELDVVGVSLADQSGIGYSVATAGFIMSEDGADIAEPRRCPIAAGNCGQGDMGWQKSG